MTKTTRCDPQIAQMDADIPLKGFRKRTRQLASVAQSNAIQGFIVFHIICVHLRNLRIRSVH